MYDVSYIEMLGDFMICSADTCDGKQLPLYDAQAVCDRMKKHCCSAGKAATQLGFDIQSTIQTLPDQPFSVYDSNGVRLVFNMPGFFSSKVKEVSTIRSAGNSK